MLNAEDEINLALLLSVLGNRNIVSIIDDKISYINRNDNLLASIEESKMFNVIHGVTMIDKAIVKPKYRHIFNVALSMVDL